jgi:hypothetical protein
MGEKSTAVLRQRQSISSSVTDTDDPRVLSPDESLAEKIMRSTMDRA